MQFYRYKDRPNYYTDLHIELKIFNLIKETPCGYWIGNNKNTIIQREDKKRWVSKTSRKRFAYPTKKEALKNLKARKTRQIQILQEKLEYAKAVLYKANQEEAK